MQRPISNEAGTGKRSSTGRARFSLQPARLLYTTFIWMFCTTLSSAGAAPARERATPGVTSQVVFLYYADLEAPTQFYESIMGFKKTFDEGWVKIFKGPGDFSVGVVSSSKGFMKASEDKPVMISWTTDDVDAWNEYLKKHNVEIVSPPKNQVTGIRNMVFKDPGGYTLELFQWLKK